jgi:uncharacterized protein YozE (UPF0346 family)
MKSVSNQIYEQVCFKSNHQVHNVLYEYVNNDVRYRVRYRVSDNVWKQLKQNRLIWNR